MATDKPRFTITLDDETFDEVLAFKDRMNLKTQSKAIQKLVELGLAGLAAEQPAEEKTDANAIIVQKYHALDEIGREVVDAVMDVEGKRRPTLQIRKGTKVIPLFTAAAGPGEPVPDDGFDEYEVPTDSRANFAVKISGDSMEPELHDGDIVLCQRRRPEIGEIAVIMVNGFLLVKQYITDGANIYLRSLNRARKDLDYDILATGNETVTGYGTVIHKKIPLVRQ